MISHLKAISKVSHKAKYLVADRPMKVLIVRLSRLSLKQGRTSGDPGSGDYDMAPKTGLCRQIAGPCSS